MLNIRDQLQQIVDNQIEGKELCLYLQSEGFEMISGKWRFDDQGENVSREVTESIFNEGQLRIKNIISDLINKIDVSILLDDKICP